MYISRYRCRKDFGLRVLFRTVAAGEPNRELEECKRMSGSSGTMLAVRESDDDFREISMRHAR